MSEAVTITGVSTPITIYGTFQGAKDYIAAMFGDTYAAWTALVGSGSAVDDPKKQTLVAATRYLESWNWDPTTAGSFAARDAIPAFQQAVAELAVLVADDPSVLGARDAGSNIRGVGAGSSRVDFFAPTSAEDGSATVMPVVVQRLIGQYGASASSSIGGGITSGTDGKSVFDVTDCEGNPVNPYDRFWSW